MWISTVIRLRQFGHFLWLGICVFCLGGCAWLDHPDFKMPNWRAPGPAYYQQYQAVRADPYPQNDLGPEIIGGRPRGYQVPPNEVSRSRQSRSWGNWRGQPQ